MDSTVKPRPALRKMPSWRGFIARKPLDGRGQEAELFRTIARLFDRFLETGQHMVADADGRTLIVPRDVEKNARRCAVLLVPMKRRADQIAVPVLAADDDHPDLRDRLFANAPPRIRDQPIGGQLFQYAFQVYAIGALDAECPGDLAAADGSRR